MYTEPVLLRTAATEIHANYPDVVLVISVNVASYIDIDRLYSWFGV